MNDIALLLSNIKKKKAQNKSVEISEIPAVVQTKPVSNHNIFNNPISIPTHTIVPPAPLVPLIDLKPQTKTDNKILFKALITPPSKPEQTPIIKQAANVNTHKQKKGDIQIRAPANINITRQKPAVNRVPPPPPPQTHHTNVKVSDGALLNIKNAKEKREAQMRQQLKKSVDQSQIKHQKEKQQEKSKEKEKQKVNQNEMQDGQIVQNNQLKNDQLSVQPLLQTQNKQKQVQNNIPINFNSIFTIPHKKQIVASIPLNQVLQKQADKKENSSDVITKPHPEEINQILKNIPISMEVENHNNVQHKPQQTSKPIQILKPAEQIIQQQQKPEQQQIKPQSTIFNTVPQPNIFQTPLQPILSSQPNIFQTNIPPISIPPIQTLPVQAPTIITNIPTPNNPKQQLHQKLTSKQLHRLKRLQTQLSLCLQQFNQLAQLKKSGKFTPKMSKKLDIVKIALNEL